MNTVFREYFLDFFNVQVIIHQAEKEELSVFSRPKNKELAEGLWRVGIHNCKKFVSAAKE